MKKQWINFWLLFSPIILLIFIPAGYFAALKISVFIPFAILTWIYNAIFSPILHFGAVASFVKKGLISKKKAVISSLTYFALVAISNLGLALAIFCSPRLETYNKGFNLNNYYAELLISDAVTGLLWAAICCLIIVGYFVIVTVKRRSLFLTVETVCVIIATALLPVLVDRLKVYFKIEWEKYTLWSYLMPVLMISLFSCLLGLGIKRRLGIVKLVLWYFGIFVAIFGMLLLNENLYTITILLEQPEQLLRKLLSLHTTCGAMTFLPLLGCLLCFLLKKDTLEKNGLVID